MQGHSFDTKQLFTIGVSFVEPATSELSNVIFSCNVSSSILLKISKKKNLFLVYHL
jgi:hypothetical protein